MVHRAARPVDSDELMRAGLAAVLSDQAELARWPAP
jgi:hypothetical protein